MTGRSEELRIRVVIAEDEPPVARFLQTLVEKDPSFEVVCSAYSGEEAVEFIQDAEVDLLISDIKMSGKSGLELAKQLREYPGRNIHIVLITGYREFEYARKAVDLKVDAFLTKPLDAEEFALAMERIKRAYAEKSAADTADTIQRLFEGREEKAFAKAVGAEFCSVMLIECRGALDHIAKLVKKDILQIRYKSCLILLNRNRKENSYFSTLVTKISAMRERPRTCSILTVCNFPLEDNGISVLRHLCRDYIPCLCIPGKLTARSFDIPGRDVLSTIARTICNGTEYENELQQISFLIKNENTADAFDAIGRLSDRWNAESAPVNVIRKNLHEITELMARAGWLTEEKIYINDQIDEAVANGGSCREIGTAVKNLYHLYLKEDRNAGKDKKIFEQICSTVESNWDENLTMQAICQKYQVSAPYVRKIFKKYTGKSYHDYVLDRKIEYAAEYIEKHPEIYIKDLAEMLGFEQLYFGTVFRKRKGMLPSKYKTLMMERGK